jgi:hypothetical protein
MVLCPASFNKNEDQEVLYSPEFFLGCDLGTSEEKYIQRHKGWLSIRVLVYMNSFHLFAGFPSVWDRQNC